MQANSSIPAMKPIDWPVIGFVWIFNIAFFVVQDIVKIFTYKCFDYYGSIKQKIRGSLAEQAFEDSLMVFTTMKRPVGQSILTLRAKEAAQSSPTPNHS